MGVYEARQKLICSVLEFLSHQSQSDLCMTADSVWHHDYLEEGVDVAAKKLVNAINNDNHYKPVDWED